MVGLRAELSLTRNTSGLPILMVISALVMPGWLWIANTHRAHWSSTIGGDYWGEFVVPWSGRAWLMITLFAATGWAAGSVSRDPRSIRNWTHGLVPGIAAGVVSCMGVLPSWGWMIELGLTSFSQSIESLVMSASIVMLGACAAGRTSVYTNASMGMLGGLLSGGLLIWLLWGTLV